MQRTNHLHVVTELSELATVLDWFQSLQQNSVTETDWIECQIALAEAFTNAVRHAHRAMPTVTPIEIDVNFFPECVELRIWDYGPPFNLKTLVESSVSVLQDTESGRGLLLIQKIADEIEYQRVDASRNCLLLTKRRS